MTATDVGKSQSRVCDNCSEESNVLVIVFHRDTRFSGAVYERNEICPLCVAHARRYALPTRLEVDAFELDAARKRT